MEKRTRDRLVFPEHEKHVEENLGLRAEVDGRKLVLGAEGTDGEDGGRVGLTSIESYLRERGKWEV